MDINPQDLPPERGLPVNFYFFTIKEIAAAADRLFRSANDEINKLSHKISELNTKIKQNPGADTPALRQEYQEYRKRMELHQEDIEWTKDIVERGYRLTPEDSETSMEMNLRDMVRLSLKPKSVKKAVAKKETATITSPNELPKSVTKKGGKG
jgi:hypothetical protein